MGAEVMVGVMVVVDWEVDSVAVAKAEAKG